MNVDEIAKFLFEVGQLKRVKRSGWWVAGVKDPESVADHSYRAIVIAYFLAKLEKADPGKTALMVAVHDFPETRINDLHKLGQKYIDSRAAEERVLADQMSTLPAAIAHEVRDLHEDYANDKSKEGIIARDADLLEVLVTAKEYMEIGYKDTADWIKNARKLLRTNAAKAIADSIISSESKEWWIHKKKIER